MNTRKLGILGLAFFLGTILFSQSSQANDLKVTNVRLGPRDTSAKTLAVFFDISWQNSWRNKINHDAAWVTVRLQDVSLTSLEKKLCPMTVAGLNPNGAARGSGTDLEVYIPSDKTGAFLRRSTNHSPEDITTASAMLTVNYDVCGLTETSQVSATVVALEMVYIPEGSFFAGDFATSAAALQRGGADNAPWPVTSESFINVTGTAGNGYYYVSAGNADEFPSGSAFAIPAGFPKGFKGFYMMKYELTEGQWVEFVNSLSAPARARRDVTNASHKNSDAVVARNTVSCSGSPLLCMTERPFRAMTYLSWTDLAAFLDWAALRPLTELEFEKAARGPFVPVNGEYAWGTTNITAAAAVSGSFEDGTELVTTSGANVRFNNISLSGGDAASGPEFQQGALRAGIFSTDSSGRENSGAGNYGAMDLSGNVKEWVVSVGNTAGLGYDGGHGDGFLTAAAGFEGNANIAGWPGMDADITHGVVTAAGVGFRGGSWADLAARLSISDRSEAASAVSDATSTYGGRGVRSAESQ